MSSWYQKVKEALQEELPVTQISADRTNVFFIPSPIAEKFINSLEEPDIKDLFKRIYAETLRQFNVGFIKYIDKVSKEEGLDSLPFNRIDQAMKDFNSLAPQSFGDGLLLHVKINSEYLINLNIEAETILRD